MPVIIIEGIDRVGKTTLANLIKRKFDAKVFKDKMFVAEDMKDRILITEKIATIVNMLKLWPIDKMLVIDRFHLSEVVYGDLDREYINKDIKIDIYTKDILGQQEYSFDLGPRILHSTEKVDKFIKNFLG